MKAKKPLSALLKIFFSFAVTIFILDYAGRILLKKHNFPLVDKPEISALSPFSVSYAGLLPYQFNPGFKGREWFTDFSINSFGFRGPEFNPVKPAGTVRILCLGDSCTFGTAGLEDADTYPEVLEKILNEGQKPMDFEVINAGMPGYSVFQGFVLLKTRRLMELKPDLVIICYGWNDHKRSGISDSSSAYQRSINNFLKDHFALWRYFSYRRKNKHEIAKERLTPSCPLRVSQNQYKYYLSRMIDYVTSGNSKVLVMNAPWEPRLMNRNDGWLAESTLESFYLHPVYAELTRRICERKHAKLIDLYAIFESMKTDNRSEFFNDPFHYNKTAARLIALEIKKIIGGLFPTRLGCEGKYGKTHLYH